MSTANVHLELLLGKLVRDPGGAKVGRIFSVLGEIDGEDCVVREYGLGTASLLVSLGISVTRILPPASSRVIQPEPAPHIGSTRRWTVAALRSSMSSVRRTKRS